MLGGLEQRSSYWSSRTTETLCHRPCSLKRPTLRAEQHYGNPRQTTLFFPIRTCGEEKSGQPSLGVPRLLDRATLRRPALSRRLSRCPGLGASSPSSARCPDEPGETGSSVQLARPWGDSSGLGSQSISTLSCLLHLCREHDGHRACTGWSPGGEGVLWRQRSQPVCTHGLLLQLHPQK